MRLHPRALTVVAALGLAVPLTGTARADDVTTTAGKKITGKLISVDAQGITFATAEARVPISARDIVVVDLANEAVQRPKDTPFAEIELTDGSTLPVARYTLKGKKFETDQLPGPAKLAPPVYDLPMSAVFSAMKKADSPKQREAWKKLLGTRGKRDLYVVQQDAGLTFVQGTIVEGFERDGAWRLSFENEDAPKEGAPKEGVGKNTLLQSRAAGLVFYQPQPATIAPTLCQVLDVFGNKLSATAIKVAPEGVTVTTVSGATVTYASTAALVRLNYQLGNVAYLSELLPQVEGPEVPEEEKKLNPTVPFLKDRSLSNDAIKLDNVTFQKGLCVAPDTVLTYALNGDYSQFKATIGIDENGANATSAAKVTIEADGQVLFSKLLRRKDKGEGVTLAVKGAKQLRLIVEADTPFNGNYVTLAEARVQK